MLTTVIGGADKASSEFIRSLLTSITQNFLQHANRRILVWREENILFGRFCGLIRYSRTFELKVPSDWQLVGAFHPQHLIIWEFYNIKSSRSRGHAWIGYRPQQQTKQLVVPFEKNDNKPRSPETEDACKSSHVFTFNISFVLNWRRIKRKSIAAPTLYLQDTHVFDASLTGRSK